MEAQDRRAILLLMAGGLALALLGQAYLSWRRMYVWDGLVFYVLGVFLWVAALRRVEARLRRPALLRQALRAAAARP
ncbi:MAG TPA: hypothetical protein EYH30_06720, partial [Anaerolineales bacterium]|nr:hypothetical protein [Anaerolineales bacterium]